MGLDKIQAPPAATPQTPAEPSSSSRPFALPEGYRQYYGLDAAVTPKAPTGGGANPSTAPIQLKRSGSQEEPLVFQDLVDCLKEKGALPGPLTLGGEAVAVAAADDRIQLEGRGSATIRVKIVRGQARPVDYGSATITLGTQAEIFVSAETHLDQAYPELVRALSELYAQFVRVRPVEPSQSDKSQSDSSQPSAPKGAPRFYGAINGVVDIGNVTGGHVHIGRLDGELHVNGLSAVGTYVGEARDDSIPSAVRRTLGGETLSKIGSDRLDLGDLAGGDVYIESIRGVLVLHGQVVQPATVRVDSGALTRLALDEMKIVGVWIRLKKGELATADLFRKLSVNISGVSGKSFRQKDLPDDWDEQQERQQSGVSVSGVSASGRGLSAVKSDLPVDSISLTNAQITGVLVEMES